MNTQALLDMANLAEEHGVDMGYWFVRSRDKLGACGTAGCLVGTYLYHHQKVLPDVSDQFELDCRVDEVADHFGISLKAAKWLFLWLSPKYQNIRYSCIEDAASDTAIRRLRRYIYFKIKQREIDEAWNERQHTRHAQSENTNHVAELIGT